MPSPPATPIRSSSAHGTINDGPAPSANGTMLMVLTRLAILTGEGAYATRANTLIQAMGDEATVRSSPPGPSSTASSIFASALQILVIGHKGNARTQELLRTVWGKALPNRLVTQIEPGDALPPGHPATGQTMQGGQPTAFICQRNVCSTPFTSAVVAQPDPDPAAAAATAAGCQWLTAGGPHERSDDPGTGWRFLRLPRPRLPRGVVRAWWSSRKSSGSMRWCAASPTTWRRKAISPSPRPVLAA